jgi:TldD protein
MPTTLADAQNLLSDLIAQYSGRVDYLMIRLEEAEGTDILLRGDKVETLSEGISIGGHIRACYKGGWGLSCFNQLATIKDRIEEAIAAARMVGDEETLLAPIDPVQAICILPLKGADPRNIPLSKKKQLCDRYAQLLKSVDRRITTTSVRYGDSAQKVIIATSEGTLIEPEMAKLSKRDGKLLALAKLTKI